MQPLAFMIVRPIQISITLCATIAMVVLASIRPADHPNNFWLFGLLSLVCVMSLFIGWKTSLDRWPACILDTSIIGVLIPLPVMSLATAAASIGLMIDSFSKNWIWFVFGAIFNLTDMCLMLLEAIVLYRITRISADAVIDSES